MESEIEGLQKALYIGADHMSLRSRFNVQRRIQKTIEPLTDFFIREYLSSENCNDGCCQAFLFHMGIIGGFNAYDVTNCFQDFC